MLSLSLSLSLSLPPSLPPSPSLCLTFLGALWLAGEPNQSRMYYCCICPKIRLLFEAVNLSACFCPYFVRIASGTSVRKRAVKGVCCHIHQVVILPAQYVISLANDFLCVMCVCDVSWFESRIGCLAQFFKLSAVSHVDHSLTQY